MFSHLSNATKHTQGTLFTSVFAMKLKINYSQIAGFVVVFHQVLHQDWELYLLFFLTSQPFYTLLKGVHVPEIFSCLFHRRF